MLLPPPQEDPDWPELAKAIEERKQAQSDAEAASVRAAGEFGLPQHDPHRYERPQQIDALIEQWELPVGALLLRIARETWPQGGFTLQSKLGNHEPGEPNSLFWEVDRAEKFTHAWYTVELALDNAFEPAGFWVECAKPPPERQPGQPPPRQPRPGQPLRLPAAPTLEALKVALVAALKNGPLVRNRHERPGRVLRRERF